MTLTYARSIKQPYKASIERWTMKLSLIFPDETWINTPLYDFFNRWTMQKSKSVNENPRSSMGQRYKYRNNLADLYAPNEKLMNSRQILKRGNTKGQTLRDRKSRRTATVVISITNEGWISRK